MPSLHMECNWNIKHHVNSNSTVCLNNSRSSGLVPAAPPTFSRPGNGQHGPWDHQAQRCGVKP